MNHQLKISTIVQTSPLAQSESSSVSVSRVGCEPHAAVASVWGATSGRDAQLTAEGNNPLSSPKMNLQSSRIIVPRFSSQASHGHPLRHQTNNPSAPGAISVKFGLIFICIEDEEVKITNICKDP